MDRNPAEQIAKWTPIAVAVVGCIVLILGLTTTRRGLKERLPGADQDEAAGGGGGGGAGKWEGKLVKGTGTPSKITGDWPWFRGPQVNLISTDATPLAKTWPATGPKTLWKIEVGEGFAAPAIWKGRVFLMDYDRQGQADAFRCLSLDDGQDIWRYTYANKIKRNHGMSRTIPAVKDDCAIAIGPKCNVICLEPLSGELKWKLDLVRDYNVEVPPWYAGQCPYLDGDRLILGVGGDVLMMAIEAATGKPLWTTPNPNSWQMTHSSISRVEFGGRKMYVYCASGGVVGVDAADGKILWEFPDWKISIANIPAPLPLSEGRIFLSGGYNAGSMMIQLKEQGGKLTVATLFRLKPGVFGSTQQTPILIKDHIIGVRPDGQLVCLNLEGKSVWESGPTRRFGSAPYIVAQDMIYVLDDDGTLTLAEAATTAYKELARAKVLEGPDAWGPMALVGGRLLVRDCYKLACLDVAASGN